MGTAGLSNSGKAVLKALGAGADGQTRIVYQETMKNGATREVSMNKKTGGLEYVLATDGKVKSSVIVFDPKVLAKMKENGEGDGVVDFNSLKPDDQTKILSSLPVMDNRDSSAITAKLASVQDGLNQAKMKKLAEEKGWKFDGENLTEDIPKRIKTGDDKEYALINYSDVGKDMSGELVFHGNMFTKEGMEKGPEVFRAGANSLFAKTLLSGVGEEGASLIKDIKAGDDILAVVAGGKVIVNIIGEGNAGKGTVEVNSDFLSKAKLMLTDDKAENVNIDKNTYSKSSKLNAFNKTQSDTVKAISSERNNIDENTIRGGVETLADAGDNFIDTAAEFLPKNTMIILENMKTAGPAAWVNPKSMFTDKAKASEIIENEKAELNLVRTDVKTIKVDQNWESTTETKDKILTIKTDGDFKTDIFTTWKNADFETIKNSDRNIMIYKEGVPIGIVVGKSQTLTSEQQSVLIEKRIEVISSKEQMQSLASKNTVYVGVNGILNENTKESGKAANSIEGLIGKTKVNDKNENTTTVPLYQKWQWQANVEIKLKQLDEKVSISNKKLTNMEKLQYGVFKSIVVLGTGIKALFDIGKVTMEAILPISISREDVKNKITEAISDRQKTKTLGLAVSIIAIPHSGGCQPTMEAAKKMPYKQYIIAVDGPVVGPIKNVAHMVHIKNTIVGKLSIAIADKDNYTVINDFSFNIGKHSKDLIIENGQYSPNMMKAFTIINSKSYEPRLDELFIRKKTA